MDRSSGRYNQKEGSSLPSPGLQVLSDHGAYNFFMLKQSERVLSSLWSIDGNFKRISQRHPVHTSYMRSFWNLKSLCIEGQCLEFRSRYGGDRRGRRRRRSSKLMWRCLVIKRKNKSSDKESNEASTLSSSSSSKMSHGMKKRWGQCSTLWVLVKLIMPCTTCHKIVRDRSRPRMMFFLKFKW